MFNLDKIASLSILDEPAVGINTPKREMSTPPDESSRKPSKCLREEEGMSVKLTGLDTGDITRDDVGRNDENVELKKDQQVLPLSMKGNKKKKRSPRLKIAAKFHKGNTSGRKALKVQEGQSLISDHFKTPDKGVNKVIDFNKYTSTSDDVKKRD